MTKTLDDISNDVRDQCDPVLRGVGLMGPTITRANTYFFHGYFGGEVGLEVLVEFDYFFVFFLPFRPCVEGEVPIGYRDSSGRVQKMYLEEALEKLGLPCDKPQAELKRLGGDYRNCHAMVSILLEVFKIAWPTVLERKDFLFQK